jgi:copper(I)-binding protein
MNKIYCSILILISCNFGAFAGEIKTQAVVVSDSFIRETIPGTSVSSAYFTLVNNTSKTLTLVGTSSKRSPRVEIHEHSMLDGMMRMRQRDSIVINGLETVVLQPSGLHLMFFDISKPMRQGETVAVTLHFAEQQDLVIDIPVQSIKQVQKKHIRVKL